MKTYKTIEVTTDGEKFYSITSQVEDKLQEIIDSQEVKRPNGLLHLFVMHTSCALTISESHDPSAKKDMGSFMAYIAPENLPFIEHKAEGADDSPSHMKSILLNQSLSLIVENKRLVLGTWQGIFLAEFRSCSHTRRILLKFIAD